MASVDWVVVPSIWWENSPLVIQEAFGYGRPVICSDIGGMAEKVTDGRERPALPSRRCRQPGRDHPNRGRLAGLRWQLSAAIQPPYRIEDSARDVSRDLPSASCAEGGSL